MAARRHSSSRRRERRRDLIAMERESSDYSSSSGNEEGSSSISSGMDSSSVTSSSDESESGMSSEGYCTNQSDIHTLPQPPTMLHWIRLSALRLHDNPALNHALGDPTARFRAVFVIDPWFASGERKFGVNRWRFLLEALHDLDKRLRSFGSRLYVAKGQPVAVLERLCHSLNVTHLTYLVDREPRSLVLEETVDRLADSMRIRVHKFSAHTLYDTKHVLAINGGRTLTTFKDFKRLLPLLGSPDPPIPTPDISLMKRLVYDDKLDREEYMIPTLEDLGFPDEELYTNHWIGGETEALRRLPIYCQLRCQQSSNSVDVLFDKSSLSPYVRFGCLSVRFFLWNVRWFAQTNPAMESVAKDITSKLLLREFYLTVATQVPNFDSYANNPICLPLPWEDDRNMYLKWKEGRTGYPWIDAGMRQLRKEGWIHYCLRESVATFLTRGDLWISWVWGKDSFEEYMLDFEPSVSCGCWMRSSCSAFVTGPVEHYCPVTFGQKIDPQGLFIRAYIPQLRNFPSEYIYCPWMAPVELQVACGCRIGIDYPHPMIDHTTAGALCCERLRRVMSLFQQRHKSHPRLLHTHTTSTAVVTRSS